MNPAQNFDSQQPMPEDLQPGAVGRLLRETRERYGQDIATVSHQLRIRSVYLKAIEDGSYQDLPGSTYAVGFVRTYAEYLGLDPQEIVRRFRDEAAEVNRRTRLVFPTPTTEAKVPSGALVMIALAVAVLAYGGWYYLSDRDRSLVDLVPNVPQSLQALVGDNGTEGETADNATTSSPTTATAAEHDTDATNGSAGTDTGGLVTYVAPSDGDDTGASVGPATGAIDTADGALVDSAASSDLAANNPAVDGNGAVIEADETADSTAAAETDAAEDIAAAASDVPADEATLPDPTAEDAADLTSDDAAAVTTDEAASAAAAETSDASETAASDAGTTGASAVPDTSIQVAAIPEAPRAPDSVQDTRDYGVAFAGSRIVIVARMESFLRVRDEQGNEIWSRLLRAGDRYLVPERDGLTLTVGNAGGIDIFVDGTKAPALGAVGVGATGIALDADRLIAGTALP